MPTCFMMDTVLTFRYRKTQVHQDVHLNACARNLQWCQSQNPNWKLAQCLSTVKQMKCLHNTMVNNLSAGAQHKNDDPWIHVNEVSQTGYQMVLLHSKFKTGKQMLFKTHIISPLTTQKNMLSLRIRAGHTPICTKCRTHYISIVKDNEISTLTCILCFNQKHLKQAI